ncbi:hypothetical protein ACFV3T_09210, partial [Streptomyces albidoflavus]
LAALRRGPEVPVLTGPPLRPEECGGRAPPGVRAGGGGRGPPPPAPPPGGPAPVEEFDEAGPEQDGVLGEDYTEHGTSTRS